MTTQSLTFASPTLRTARYIFYLDNQPLQRKGVQLTRESQCQGVTKLIAMFHSSLFGPRMTAWDRPSVASMVLCVKWTRLLRKNIPRSYYTLRSKAHLHAESVERSVT
jgi:hypothetical protein